MEIKTSTMTKFITIILGIVIFIMSIGRITSLKIDSPQDIILSVHFM